MLWHGPSLPLGRVEYINNLSFKIHPTIPISDELHFSSNSKANVKKGKSSATFKKSGHDILTAYCFYPTDIEEGFIKKPRKTVVAAFWGKMATHMLLSSLCSRQIVTRRAGSKLRGSGICILHSSILANKIINKVIKSVFKLEIQIYIKHPPPLSLCTF